ncbi:hypothetical protein GIB67_012334 [Kingdonia uniflora]|uniref:Uncharacterized protein n=1 Tax=Kingdonia uniflora TaxID=39325 RepID=A0A7J7MVS3_9MAGN|nr:hypothetical protein GIB67_012334 [Kingdonia uniflora]
MQSWLETEIGLGLTGFGIFFSFLGIIFFFDKGLLAMGNVNPILVRGDVDHWTKIHHAVLHEASKLQGLIISLVSDWTGYYLFWFWFLFGPHWMARDGNDIGSLWFHCPL